MQEGARKRFVNFKTGGENTNKRELSSEIRASGKLSEGVAATEQSAFWRNHVSCAGKRRQY